MKVQIVKNGLWIDFSRRIGKFVSAGRKTQAPVVNPVAQGSNRKAVNRQKAATVTHRDGDGEIASNTGRCVTAGARKCFQPSREDTLILGNGGQFFVGKPRRAERQSQIGRWHRQIKRTLHINSQPFKIKTVAPKA